MLVASRFLEMIRVEFGDWGYSLGIRTSASCEL